MDENIVRQNTRVFDNKATTGTAQSVIATTYTTFESFVGDNYIFLDLDECLFWISEAIKEDIDMDPWIVPADVDITLERLQAHFYKWKPEYKSMLYSYLASLSKKDLTRVYYKNNLEGFIYNHREIKELYESIFRNIVNYPMVNKKDKDWKTKIPHNVVNDFDDVDSYIKFVNVQSFFDPNTLPPTVEDLVKEFTDYLMKYVYCRYLSFDRIHRLKNFFRKTVTVIDTDSNILCLDQFVAFTKSNIMKGDYGREDINNVFIAVNTITYVITTVVQDILQYYGEHSNIPEDYRGSFNMKNEFFMTKLAIASVKKRYLSSIKLREGNMMNPEKVDIKGFDFKKAATSDEVSKKFTDMAKRHILYAEKIDMKALENELFSFKQEIIDSIRNGELHYLTIANAKELGAYKDPGSEQSVRGVIAWNMLNPDDPIELPSKVCILKLNIFSESDISDLQNTHPEIYNIIMEKIFNDRTGIFIAKQKSGLKVRGLQAIAIPSTSRIPDWIQPYIDITSVVNGIMGPFKSVMDLLKGQYVKEGRTRNSVSRKSDGLTNIIKF